MEDLAIIVGIIVLTIYSSGFIALGLSFVPGTAWRIVTYLFGSIAIASGLWLGLVLRDGNGLFVAILPISLGGVALWNTTRRNSKKNSGALPPPPPNQNFS